MHSFPVPDGMAAVAPATRRPPRPPFPAALPAPRPHSERRGARRARSCAMCSTKHKSSSRSMSAMLSSMAAAVEELVGVAGVRKEAAELLTSDGPMHAWRCARAGRTACVYGIVHAA